MEIKIHRVSTRNLFIAGISLFIFACFFSYIVFFLTDTYANYSETTGVITEYEERLDPTTNTNMYYPIIEYEVDGNKYSTYGTATEIKTETPKSVTIYYKINNPEEARLDENKTSTASKAIIVIIDAVMLLGSMAFIIYGFKRLKTDRQGL